MFEVVPATRRCCASAPGSAPEDAPSRLGVHRRGSGAPRGVEGFRSCRDERDHSRRIDTRQIGLRKVDHASIRPHRAEARGAGFVRREGDEAQRLAPLGVTLGGMGVPGSVAGVCAAAGKAPSAVAAAVRCRKSRRVLMDTVSSGPLFGGAMPGELPPANSKCNAPGFQADPSSRAPHALASFNSGSASFFACPCCRAAARRRRRRSA